MSGGSSNRIAIVVASSRDPALLADCLRSIAPIARAHAAHVIVARPGGRESVEIVQQALNDVEWVAVGEHADIPRLRGAGLSRSESDLTLLTEDNCVVDPRWAHELIAAAAHADVVGGRMGNARRDRAIDCGAFFAEYGFFAGAHTRHGEQLTAANVLYRGSVRAQVAQWMSAGVWENVVHERLRVAGARLMYAPRAIVRQNLTHDVWRFCLDRYEHGRDYARVRLAEQGGSRLRGLSSAPLLPALLAYRVARISAPGQWATFLRALPATLTFFSAWAIGEARGYLTGATTREGSSP